MTLKGEKLYLRALEPEDLDFLYRVENDEAVWEVSHTQTPYSRYVLRQYLTNAAQDIYEAKQLRLAICLNGDFQAIGLIDLFDFDPMHGRAGVGILIADNERRKGIGYEALKLVTDYAFTHLRLHQLYANIASDNIASVQLFTKFGFEKTGVKKQWNKTNNGCKDEFFFQLINN